MEVGLREKIGVGMGARKAFGREAVDSLDGTGMEGKSHPCMKGYPPK